GTGTTQARQLSVKLAVTSTGGVVKVRDVATQAQATVAADGTFSISYNKSGVTPDGRNVYSNAKQVAGKIDPLGELAITRYHETASSGNSIYGYNGSVTDQTGPAFVGLTFVDPAPR